MLKTVKEIYDILGKIIKEGGPHKEFKVTIPYRNGIGFHFEDIVNITEHSGIVDMHVTMPNDDDMKKSTITCSHGPNTAQLPTLSKCSKCIRYKGVVKQVSDEEVLILFEIDNELIERIYEKEQFKDGPLPSVDDCISVDKYGYICIEKQTEQDKTYIIKPKHDFNTGPLEI